MCGQADDPSMHDVQPIADDIDGILGRMFAHTAPTDEQIANARVGILRSRGWCEHLIPASECHVVGCRGTP